MATAIPDTSQYMDSADILNTLRENIDTCKHEITDKINYYKSLFDQQKTELFAELDEIYHKQEMRLATANEDIKCLCKLKEDSCKNITKNAMKDDLDGILGYIDEKINLIRKCFEEDIPFIGIYSLSYLNLKDILENYRLKIRESIGPYKYKRNPIWRRGNKETPEGQLRKPACLSIDKITKLIYLEDGNEIQIYDMAGNYKSCINTCLDTIENIQAANLYIYTISMFEISQPNTRGNKVSLSFPRLYKYSLAKLNKNNGDVVQIITLGKFLDRSNTLLSIDSNETNIYTATQHNLITPHHNNLITVYKCSDLEQINQFTLKSEYVERMGYDQPRLKDISISNDKLYVLIIDCEYELLVFSLEGVLIQNLISHEDERDMPSAFCIDSSNNILITYLADIIIYNTDGKALHNFGDHKITPVITAVDVCDQTIVVLYCIYFNNPDWSQIDFNLAAF